MNLKGWKQIYSLDDVKSLGGSYAYVVEYKNQTIKIGHTGYIRTRLGSIISSAVKYTGFKVSGQMAISPKCINDSEIEHCLHYHFQEYRKVGTEIFNISFEDFFNNLPELDYKTENDPEYIERNKKMDEFMKAFFTPNLHDKSNENNLVNWHKTEDDLPGLEEPYLVCEKSGELVSAYLMIVEGKEDCQNIYETLQWDTMRYGVFPINGTYWCDAPDLPKADANWWKPDL